MNHRNTSQTRGARNSGRPSGPEAPASTLSTDVRVWKVNKVNSKKAPYQTPLDGSGQGEDGQLHHRRTR